MAKVNHVVVARTFRPAALYAEKNAWSMREWTVADTVDKLRGLTYVTVHLMQETWNGFDISELNRITAYLMRVCQVNNLAVVIVIK